MVYLQTCHNPHYSIIIAVNVVIVITFAEVFVFAVAGLEPVADLPIVLLEQVVTLRLDSRN